MLYINDDNEYDSNNEHDEFLELNPEIKSEIEYDRKICIIDFYKDKLYYEPDFTGIRNISSAHLLYIIETTHIPCKLCTKNHELTNNEIRIFDNMYNELFNIKNNIDIYNTVSNCIFEKIYVI